MSNIHGLAAIIRQYYPQYWGISKYPINKCCAIRKTKDEWGILGNFGNVPLVIDSIMFKNSEQLYHLFKFKYPEAIRDIYASSAGMGVKMKAKHWEKTSRRNDWENMVIDAMKFVLTLKFKQSDDFRQALAESEGHYIVEDQTSRKRGKSADCWGVVDDGNGHFVGPNLLGRLLMELRDGNGTLDYHLPDDAFKFVEVLKLQQKS